MNELVFSRAETANQLRQVHELNHTIFAEELGQHQARSTRVLIDRFDLQNSYFIASQGDEVLGMIAVNLSPPFSIEKRLPDPALLRSHFQEACEVRLLSIRSGERKRMILAGLFWKVYEYAHFHRRTHLLISGIQERRETYAALGFEELGPGRREGRATFIPMALDLNDSRFTRKAHQFGRWWTRRGGDRRSQMISLMPGPVEVSDAVREAYQRPAVSHRGEINVQCYNSVRSRLSTLVGGMPVAVLSGSGTLANDAIAMALKLKFGDACGLVLANGEFGERLVAHASRVDLNFCSIAHPWGSPWERERILAALHRDVFWVWGVHLETSTGQVNHLQWLSDVCAERGIALAVDCVSSLGALPMHSFRFAFASGVSGKSLAAYAGIAMVFVATEMIATIPWSRLPATFDLARNIKEEQPVFTLPSSTLLALDAALRENFADLNAARQRHLKCERLGAWLRSRLRACGLEVLVDDETAAPVVCTVLAGEQFAECAREAGFQLAHQSCYLRERGWVQIATMGAVDAYTLQPLLVSFESRTLEFQPSCSSAASLEVDQYAG